MPHRTDRSGRFRRETLEWGRMPLPRIAWLVTVVALLIGALIMLLSHYQGYAAVFGAVAVSAAVNLR